MSTGTIRIERHDPIGYVVLDNLARRNAVSGAMWRALPAAIASLNDDPAIRCIVLRGAGDIAFAAGADISEFEG